MSGTCLEDTINGRSAESSGSPDGHVPFFDASIASKLIASLSIGRAPAKYWESWPAISMKPTRVSMSYSPSVFPSRAQRSGARAQ